MSPRSLVGNSPELRRFEGLLEGAWLPSYKSWSGKSTEKVYSGGWTLHSMSCLLDFGIIVIIDGNEMEPSFPADKRDSDDKIKQLESVP